MNEEDMKVGFKNTIDKLFQAERDKKKKFYYPILVILTYLWAIPIYLFIFLLIVINWVLTKFRLKKPEPRVSHRYFTICEIQTCKEIFRNEIESIVEAEQTRMINELGESKYNQNFYLSEVKLCGIVPKTIVQKLTHGALSLLP